MQLGELLLTRLRASAKCGKCVEFGGESFMLLSYALSLSLSYFQVKFRHENLEVISEIKYLGVIIDRNLSFAVHVDYLGKKIGTKLGLLRRIGI